MVLISNPSQVDELLTWVNEMTPLVSNNTQVTLIVYSVVMTLTIKAWSHFSKNCLPSFLSLFFIPTPANILFQSKEEIVFWIRITLTLRFRGYVRPL